MLGTLGSVYHLAELSYSQAAFGDITTARLPVCVWSRVCVPSCVPANLPACPPPVLNLQLVKRGMWEGLFFLWPMCSSKKVGFGRGEDAESG